MSFSVKPAVGKVILNNTSTNLTCSANGNPNKMSGTWVIPYKSGEMLSITKKIIETELFVSTTVSKAGIYQCQITDGIKKIEASTTVQVISGRVSVVAVIRKRSSINYNISRKVNDQKKIRGL